MKTIFFSFSAAPGFKNFFFFPDSVFDKIIAFSKTHPDVRFIFVMPEGFRDTYIPYISKKFTPQCVVETTRVVKERTALQTVFRFFYSYFVYTGTTHIMATIGIRPGEPAAGGKFKRLLGPLKRLIAKTFGRSQWLRERVVPDLYYRIFSDRPFSHLFDRYQPDMVFAGHIYGLFDTELLAEAKRRGVKTAGMISNWDHFDKYFLPFRVDALFAQSNQIKRFAIRHQGYDPAAITLVGYPYMDYMTRAAGQMARSEVLQMLGFPPESRFLLYISGSAYSPDEPEIVQEVLRWIEEERFGKNIFLVLRPYVGVRPEDREIDHEKFDRFARHPKVFTFRGEFWGDVEKSFQFVNILKQSDTVLVVYSTAALEAGVLDRPLIAPSFDGHRHLPFDQSIRRFEIREHFREVIESGALRRAYTFEDLSCCIAEYLDDPSRDRESRKRMVEDLCYKTDGNSSERVFVHLLASAGISA